MTSASVLFLIAVGFLGLAAAICFPLGMVVSARNSARGNPSDNTHDDRHGTATTQRGRTPANGGASLAPSCSGVSSNGRTLVSVRERVTLMPTPHGVVLGKPPTLP